jgi:hypothetical protein
MVAIHSNPSVSTFDASLILQVTPNRADVMIFAKKKSAKILPFYCSNYC